MKQGSVPASEGKPTPTSSIRVALIRVALSIVSRTPLWHWNGTCDTGTELAVGTFF